MSNGSWQDGNNHYLASSLQWLRLRLQKLVPEDPAPAPKAPAPAAAPTPAPVVEKTPSVLSRWLGGASTEPAPSKATPLLPAASPSEGKSLTLTNPLAAAVAAREAAANMEPLPALLLLAQRLALSPFERDTLLMAVAVEYDPGFANLYAAAQGGGRTYPTFGMALAALDDPSWEALSSHRPLREDHLLEINQPGATPLTSSPLRVDERIVNFLKGLNVLDQRLSMLLSPVDTSHAEVTLSQQASVDTILQRIQDAMKQAVLPVVQLVGPDAASKLTIASLVCGTLNRELYRIGAESLPQQPADVESFVRLWQRETFLLPLALYIDAENLDGTTAETQAAFQKFLSRGLGLVFVGMRDAPLRLSVGGFPLEVHKPTRAEQFEAWTHVLGAEESGDAAILAGQFNMNLTEIDEAAAIAVSTPESEGTLSRRLWNTCRDLTRPRLDVLAQRLDVKATWEDLVLPDVQTKMMHDIATQVRARHKVYDDWGFSQKMNRGFGITALFAGESGTGKTMAAEVIASDLGLNLYRIDLSAVVSKYIGETEKNLRRLFDAAEQGGAILFFDEADALFGKRSEVKESHDRYANIEINYLLQRMEAFSGLAILATNLKSALDPAFLRRLRFVVDFPFPSQKERKLIWQKVLPPQTPKEVLDFDRLAKLNVAGANIQSIALHAAFRAAEDGKPVSMPALLAAARTELRKLEKPFTESELKA